MEEIRYLEQIEKKRRLEAVAVTLGLSLSDVMRIAAREFLKRYDLEETVTPKKA